MPAYGSRRRSARKSVSATLSMGVIDEALRRRRRKLSRALNMSRCVLGRWEQGCEERIAFQTETQSGKLQAQKKTI